MHAGLDRYKSPCLDLRSREEVVYTILGLADAAPERNIISFQSPLAGGSSTKS